jgi:putative ABC transport system permease protein
MTLYQLIGTMELGLIYSLVGMAAYLSFRILNFPDMTVDGSYVLGAAVYATCISCAQYNPLTATFIAIFCGAIAGGVTALLSTRFKMLNLLSGIVTMTALYSINLRIMGKPNIALLNESSIFSWFEGVPKIVPLCLIVLSVWCLLSVFLKTQIGLALRSTGNNQKMTRAQGINDKILIAIGLCIANALVALAGALYAQYSGFSDINLGIGTVITGLAALIIGEALFSHRRVQDALFACISGAVLFYTITAMALNFGDFGLQTSDQKLLTAIFMTIGMVIPKIRKKFIHLFSPKKDVK